MRIHIKIVLLLSLCLFLLLIGLIWLSLATFFMGSIYILFSLDYRPITWVKNNFFFSSVITLIWVFVIAIFLRVFILEIYAIPSSSMEDALLPGDKIIVSKLNYGPKLPESPFEIPWINILFYFNKTAMAKGTGKWWDYQRLSGFSKIRRNDIVVFKDPGEEQIYYIKRCVALPGDTLHVKNSEVYINGSLQQDLPSIKKLYQVFLNDKARAKKVIEHNKFHSFDHPKNMAEIFLSKREKEQLEASGAIDSIRVKLMLPNEKFPAYPYIYELFPWSTDEYGPLTVPTKGLTIELNKKTFTLYKNLLHQFEQKDITEKDNVFYLDGKIIKEYTFDRDYFFMMGDNRHDSKDSRFIGLVPHMLVEGKASFILFSKDDKGFRVKRTLKVL